MSTENPFGHSISFAPATVTWGDFSASQQQRFSLSGATMGTRFSAVFYAEPTKAHDGLPRLLQAAVDLVDRQMSNWRSDSDLTRVNNASPGCWVEIPDELATVIDCGLTVGRQSVGAFDIAVGEIVDAWGFGPAGSRPEPSRIASAAAPRAPAFTILDLDRAARRIRKRCPATLDLCGIAKGFAVDQLAAVLDGAGIASYLVSIDGELRARGTKPDGMPWTVAIERPERGLRDAQSIIEFTDRAVATSGDYRRSLVHEGRVVSHTVNPATGQPLANRLASVTVLASDCMQADAWATALLVLGEREGPFLAAQMGLDALFLVHGANVLRHVGVGVFEEAGRNKS